MSDLQIALAGVGALVIICVIVYNRVQESRFRRRVEASFVGERGDALLDPLNGGPKDRIEPLLNSGVVGADDAAETVNARAGRVEPVGVPADASPESAGEESSPIDYAVQVTCEHALQRPALHHLLDALDGLGRRTQVMASVGDGGWVALAEGTEGATRIRVALQLADRRGHVTEDDLGAFVKLVKQWAQGIGATVKAPDPKRYLDAAKELDRFCADVDVVVGLNVVAPSGEPFSGTKVRSCAEAVGFRLENGNFRLADVTGRPLFTMESQQGEPFDLDRLSSTTMNGVTLLLDVPRLEQGVKVFDQMIDTGKQIADALGGTLVDDNRTPVTEAGLEQIRNQLRGIYTAMEARGIDAGSRLALRLFS
ncbi:MAG TPA: cell division protein ZipA C-terminal FtsZ-binding domain-containing protein [Burkholderiales bacterium]|nr:cell division protein ZipA C-terminal FtsZ-binding domain-containing protein [Burkholderiales bacterium]